MMSLAAKEINDTEKFQKFCKILETENHYTTLVENMQLAYCILECADTLGKQNDQEILFALKEIKFFDNDDEKMLTGPNKVEIIVATLKSKDLQYFMTFLLCLKKIPNCSTIVHKIESKLAHLNNTSYFKISPVSNSSTKQLFNFCMPNTPLHELQQHFRGLYKSSSFTITGVLDTPKIFYINLALIIVDDEKPDFLDYGSLLFKQESTYSKTMLTSLSQIFIEDQRVVLVQGSPGSGKTTLAKKICRDWVEGKLLKTFTHVILVELKDTRVAEVTSIRELIELYMGNLSSGPIAKEINDTKGKGILFLLEGWDELPETSRYSALFTDLISGKLLPDALIVITSRPSASGSLPYEYIHRRIEILGFTKPQIVEYIENYFKDHDNRSEVVKDVLSQIDSSPCLKHMVYVPVNLSIVLFIFKQNNQQIPQNYTALYKTFLLILLNLYQEKKLHDYRKAKSFKHLPDCILTMLQKMGRMAYYQLLHDKMIFTEEVVKDYCFDSKKIPEEFDGMGLLQMNNRKYSTHNSKTYHFIHRTLQELLSALYLSQQPLTFQRKELQCLFNQKGLEMVWIFYAGLTKFEHIPFDTFFQKSIVQWIKICKTKVWSDLVHYGINKKLLRFSSTSEIFATYFATEQYSNGVSKCISREFQITLMAIAMEVESPLFCKTICNSYLFNEYTCWFTVPDSAVTPQILSALSYCISHGEKQWIVQCKKLDNDGAISLLQYLTCSIEGCDHKTCHHHNSIRVLDLYSSPDQIDGLVKIIHHQNSLQYIVLSQSASLDNNCVIKLADALCNNTSVKILHLLGCNLTAVGIQALANMLKSNSTLEWIALRDNRDTMEEDSIISLMETIYHHNSTLYMLALDSKFHERPAVQSCLQKINRKRQEDKTQELCIRIVDCVRYSDICQRLFTLQ